MQVTDLAVARAERGLDAQYQRGMERGELAAQAEDEIADQLRVAYLAGLNGSNVFLPFVGRNQHLQWVERTQPVWDAVLDDLDAAGIAPLVKQVLSESQCPLVAALKVALADKYAKYWAGELAEIRA